MSSASQSMKAVRNEYGPAEALSFSARAAARRKSFSARSDASKGSYSAQKTAAASSAF